MKITGTRFGEIEYSNDDIVTFPEGMIGFGEFHEYVVVNTKEGSPYRWLQSLDEPKLAFLLSMPESFLASYSPEIRNEEAAQLGLTKETDYLVLVTTTIPPGQPQQATANLAAPVIINLETRRAKQVILDDEAYTIRYPIFAGTQDVAKTKAA